MLIKFKKIAIENFLSFGSRVEIPLDNRGYTLVEGVNNDPTDNASSNGSGKSAIFDAILFCLTGNTARGTNKNLININTEGDMEVSLDFSVDKNDYTITRTRSRSKNKSTIEFYVNGEDKSGKGVDDTKEIIKGYLPELTESLITSVIILGQGMPNKFTDNTPSGRKEILEKLSKSDFMIEDIKDRLNRRKDILNESIYNLDITLASDNSKLDAYQRQLEQYKTNLNDLTPVSQDEIDEEKKQSEEIKKKIDNLNDDLKTKKEDFENTSLNSASIKDEKASALQRLNDKWNPSIQKIKNEEVETKTLANSLQNEIIRIRSTPDVCPTCGQAWPEKRVDTKDKEEELKRLNEKLADLKTQREELENNYRNEANGQEEQFKQKELININKSNKLRQEISALNTEIETYTNSYTHSQIKINSLQQSYNNYQQRKDELETLISTTTNDVKIKNDEILYNTKERESEEGSLSVVNKMMTIASRDFRGILLANVIEYLNKRTKVYCMDIFGTDKIELVLDGNNLNVSYDDKLYENLSGGEKKRVDIICQLSIRDMLSQFSNFSSNILVLDEFTDSLDKTSTEAVLDCLAKRLNDVESTFIVTHMTNLSIPVDSTITIAKNDQGVSNVI